MKQDYIHIKHTKTVTREQVERQEEVTHILPLISHIRYLLYIAVTYTYVLIYCHIHDVTKCCSLAVLCICNHINLLETVRTSEMFVLSVSRT